MSTPPPCLDCGAPLTRAPGGPAYPEGSGVSSVYLCPFCRTHRYSSEEAAVARCRAGLQRRGLPMFGSIIPAGAE